MKHSPQTHRVKIVAIMVVALAAVVAWGSWETQPSRTVAVSEVAAQSSAFVVSEGAVADAAAASARPDLAQQQARLSIDH